MALKKTLAEFMGVSEEWLAGYEAAKAEEQSCDGCKYEFMRHEFICHGCKRDKKDNYKRRKVV